MELQLAMDLFSLEDAVAMAQRLQADADIIEIGTPLLMREGIRAIRIMQESCPKCRILADCKIMDAGGLEAEMAFSAGADIVTVCGAASDATIEAALGAARQAGKQILVDLIAVKDLETRAAWPIRQARIIFRYTRLSTAGAEDRRWRSFCGSSRSSRAESLPPQAESGFPAWSSSRRHGRR